MALHRTPTAPVGAALREARIAAGLTTDELAVTAGVGSATVERIECGRVTPRRATLIALALALGEGPVTQRTQGADPGLSKTAAGVGRHGESTS